MRDETSADAFGSSQENSAGRSGARSISTRPSGAFRRAKMKGRVMHIVPLAKQAVRILKESEAA